MNNPEIVAAKMICKSVDALTREIYLQGKVRKRKHNQNRKKRKIRSPLGMENEKKFFATGRG